MKKILLTTLIAGLYASCGQATELKRDFGKIAEDAKNALNNVDREFHQKFQQRIIQKNLDELTRLNNLINKEMNSNRLTYFDYPSKPCHKEHDEQQRKHHEELYNQEVKEYEAKRLKAIKAILSSREKCFSEYLPVLENLKKFAQSNYEILTLKQKEQFVLQYSLLVDLYSAFHRFSNQINNLDDQYISGSDLEKIFQNISNVEKIFKQKKDQALSDWYKDDFCANVVNANYQHKEQNLLKYFSLNEEPSLELSAKHLCYGVRNMASID